MILKSKKTKL